MFRSTISRLNRFRKLNRGMSTPTPSSSLKRLKYQTSSSKLTSSPRSVTFSGLSGRDGRSALLVPSSSVTVDVLRSFSRSSSFNKNNDEDSSRIDRKDVTQRLGAAETTVDEEYLLEEYYRSYKEDVWKAGNDDERDVRWMDMLGNRGVEGVFDIDELVNVLKAENVQDIVCVRIPDEMNYADYLLIGTGFSFRHLKSVMEYIKKLHKGKKWSKDPHAVIEGLESEDWLVMDMGNVVLHLLQSEARRELDLETLWTVGGEFDEMSIQGRKNNASLESLVFVQEDDSWDLDEASLRK